MRANHYKLRAGGIIAGAMFAVACGSGPDDSVRPKRPPPGQVERLLAILEAGSIPPAALVDSILDTAPTHPAADTASRTHVQCHFVRNIRTRPTLAPNPDGVQDIDGPSGELCAVEAGYNRGRSLVHGAWIATARIDTPIVAPQTQTDVPHLGMQPGVNLILAARRGSGYLAVVFPPGGVPLRVPMVLEPPYKEDRGRNGTDIAVWRGNAMKGCVSCWQRGWCTVG